MIFALSISLFLSGAAVLGVLYALANQPQKETIIMAVYPEVEEAINAIRNDIAVLASRPVVDPQAAQDKADTIQAMAQLVADTNAAVAPPV